MQGAGIVDAFKVLTYKTSVTPAVLHLNDTDHFQPTHEVRIENKGDKPVTYHIAHEAGSTIITKPNGDAEVSFPPVPYTSGEGELATVTFSTTTLEVAAGATGTFTITFAAPAGIDAALFPIYGGWINVIGSNDEALRVTYAGKLAFIVSVGCVLTCRLQASRAACTEATSGPTIGSIPSCTRPSPPSSKRMTHSR